MASIPPMKIELDRKSMDTIKALTKALEHQNRLTIEVGRNQIEHNKLFYLKELYGESSPQYKKALEEALIKNEGRT